MFNDDPIVGGADASRLVERLRPTRAGLGGAPKVVPFVPEGLVADTRQGRAASGHPDEALDVVDTFDHHRLLTHRRAATRIVHARSL